MGYKDKDLFRYQDMWDLVEKSIAEDEEEGKQKEKQEKRAKALFIVQ